MYVHEEVLKSIKEKLEKAIGEEVTDSDVSRPPEPSMGYFSTNIAFRIAGRKGKSPVETAEEIASSMEKPEYVSEMDVKGPYVNFKLDGENYFSKVIEEALKESYGSRNSTGEKVTIDYSHPNIAKPFHIGHLRSTVIGEAIANLNEATGHEVVRINHLGDWGTQFGKLITAYKKWGDEERLEKDPIGHLNELYVRFHREAEKDSDLEDEARENFSRLEKGSEEELELWKEIRKLSIKKFQEIYERLGIEFKSYRGEAHYSRTGKAEKAVKEALDKGVAEEEPDGSIVVNLEDHGLTNYIIRKKDGSTLYSTRDIAAAEDRWKEYGFKKNIYVVRSAQNLHFKQLFKTLELLGYDWSRRCIHVPFGSINLPEGSMSTRKGNIIELKDLLDEAQERALEIIKEKNPELKNAEEVADHVGMAAIKFADLSQNRVKDIDFDWERALNFEGDTGPYLQYTHARASGIIEEVKVDLKVSSTEAAELLDTEEEKNLLKKISEFPTSIENSTASNEPHILSQYLLKLTHDFNAFYRECSVKHAETKELKSARLKLVQAFKNTLSEGLKLLGIKPLEEM